MTKVTRLAIPIPTDRPARKSLGALAGWLLLCYAVAALGAVASLHAREFYAQFVQPPWAPPAWLFGPAWTLLYTLMAIAAWIVGRTRASPERRRALLMFFVQLAFSALWSWLFFAWRRGELAFIEVLVLWVAILATLISFWRVRPAAGSLLLPYLAWVGYAAALNGMLLRLNPGLFG